jgi:hypothetical protein
MNASPMDRGTFPAHNIWVWMDQYQHGNSRLPATCLAISVQFRWRYSESWIFHKISNSKRLTSRSLDGLLDGLIAGIRIGRSDFAGTGEN